MSHVRLTQGARAALTGATLQQANLREADLRHASLERTNLSFCCLRGARLSHADLREADLTMAGTRVFAGSPSWANHVEDVVVSNTTDPEGDSTGLVASALAGTDLTSATLPANISRFDGLDHVAEISKHARTIFLATIGACVFSWLTIATTTDVSLLTNFATTPLPIIQTQVPIAGFYLAAPAILFSLYLYLHLYLQSLWQALASLPAVFPDGRALDERAYPWLLTAQVRAHFPRLRGERTAFTDVKSGLSLLAAWGLVPLTTLLFWARYLPRHDAWGTCCQRSESDPVLAQKVIHFLERVIGPIGVEIGSEQCIAGVRARIELLRASRSDDLCSTHTLGMPGNDWSEGLTSRLCLASCECGTRFRAW